MVPLIVIYVGGIPIETLISKQRLEEIVQRTRVGGGEIVRRIRKWFGYYAPSAA